MSHACKDLASVAEERDEMAIVDTPRASEPGFADWLLQANDLAMTVAVKREGDQWYALLQQFDITGAGDTRAAAVKEAFELLLAYLHAFYEDGAPFADALRPIPASLELRIKTESLIASVARRVWERLPLATESTYALPPGSLSNFVAC
jgi:hypothetical protein